MLTNGFFFSRIQLLIPQAEHFLYLATWIWNSGFSLLSYFVIGISSLYFLPYLFQWLEVCFVFVCFLKRRHKCHMSVLLIVVKILLVIWPQKLLRRLNSLIVERVEICRLRTKVGRKIQSWMFYDKDAVWFHQFLIFNSH